MIGTSGGSPARLPRADAALLTVLGCAPASRRADAILRATRWACFESATNSTSTS